ncbi:hypothetical protein A6R68_21936, partial [Neotoma lepida]
MGMTPQATHSICCRTEMCHSCTQDSQRRTPSVDGDKSLTVPIHSLRNFWHCHKLHAWKIHTADIQPTLQFSDAGSLGQKFASDNAALGSSSLGQEEPGDAQCDDMTTLVVDVHLPQLINSLTELNQFRDLTATQSKDSILKKNDQKSYNLLHGASLARILCQNL